MLPRTAVLRLTCGYLPMRSPDTLFYLCRFAQVKVFCNLAKTFSQTIRFGHLAYNCCSNIMHASPSIQPGLFNWTRSRRFAMHCVERSTGRLLISLQIVNTHWVCLNLFGQSFSISLRMWSFVILLLRLIGRRSVHIIIKKHLLVASSGFWWSATVHTQIAGVSCMIGHKLRNGFQEIFLTCALQAAVHRTRVSLISDSRNRFKKGCFLRHLVCNCYERPVRRRSFLRTVYNGIVFELHCAVVEGGRKTRAG